MFDRDWELCSLMFHAGVHYRLSHLMWDKEHDIAAKITRLAEIGRKMNVCIIALDKSGIKMKCSDGLKPLCALVHTKTSNSIVKSCKDQSLKNYDHHVKWLFAFWLKMNVFLPHLKIQTCQFLNSRPDFCLTQTFLTNMKIGLLTFSIFALL